MKDQHKQALEALFADAGRRRQLEQPGTGRTGHALDEFRQRFEAHVDAVVAPTFVEFKGFLAGKGMASFVERSHGGRDSAASQGNPLCRFCIGAEGHAHTYEGYIQVELDVAGPRAVLTRKHKTQAQPVEAAQGDGVIAYISASRLHEQLHALLQMIL
jgi:hypothetical protein